MLFKKKKSDDTKAAQLCLEMYGLVKSLVTEVKSLREQLGVYESSRDDAVSAVDIMDEWLNGPKEGRIE